MKIVTACARFWLALWMLFWGLNWFVEFLPQPIGGRSAELHLALMHSGLFTAAKLLEIVLAIALLANRFVPLTLVLSAPVTAIIAWVHMLDGPGAPGYFVVFTHIFLLWAYSPYFLSMLAPRAEPLADPASSLPSLAAAIGGKAPR